MSENKPKKFVDRPLSPSELAELVDAATGELRFCFRVSFEALVARTHEERSPRDLFVKMTRFFLYGGQQAAPLAADFLIHTDPHTLEHVIEVTVKFSQDDVAKHRELMEAAAAVQTLRDRHLVTEEMVEVGGRIAGIVYAIECARVLGAGSPGGVRDYREMLADYVQHPDYDIIAAAAEQQIKATAAMYLAMRRREPQTNGG